MLTEKQEDKILTLYCQYVIYLDTLHDEIFLCDTFEDIGNLIIRSILNKIKSLDYDTIKNFLIQRNMIDITPNFEQNIAVKSAKLEHLPKEAIIIVKHKYGEIMYDYNSLILNIEAYSKKLDFSLSILKKEKGSILQKINQYKLLGLDFCNEYKNLERIINAIELISIEIDKLNYSKSFASKTISKLNIKEINDIALHVCKDYYYPELNLKEKIDEEFKYFFEIIEIVNKHTIPSDFDLASRVVKYSMAYNQIYSILKEEIYKMSSLSKNSQELANKKISRIKDLFLQSNLNSKDIKEYIIEEQIVEDIRKNINSIWCLKNKDIIFEALRLFNNSEYKLFINIITIQIEGILDDAILGKDLFTEKKFTNLRDKVEILFSAESYEWYKYFKFDLNNIRNQIAHGNDSKFYILSLKNMLSDNLIKIIYSDSFVALNHELVACLLILDLQAIIYRVLREIEEKRIINFIEKYYLYIGKRKVDFDLVKLIVKDDYNTEYIEWITNPTYIQIYEFYDKNKICDIGITNIICEMKEILYNPEFWENTLTKYTSGDWSVPDKIEKSLSLVSKLKDDNYKDNIMEIYNINSRYLKSKNIKTIN